MIGVKIVFGTLNTFVKRRMQENPRSTMIVLATNIPRKIVYTRTLFVLKSIGPGVRPWIVSAPIMMAATASPGTPSVSIGIIAPPVTPLFPPSEAATASGLPLPNSSGCLDIPRAVLYPTKDPISAPAPGMMPMMVPISPVTGATRNMGFTSSCVGRSLVTVASISSVL